MYMLHLCEHPNILKLHDVIPSQNDLDIYLVMEEVDTDLSQVISSMSSWSYHSTISFRRITTDSYSVHYMAVVEGFEVHSFSKSCASGYKTPKHFDQF